MTGIAILGTGGMAEYQVKKFGAMDGVRIVACMDADRAKAASFAAAHAIPAVYRDIETLLSGSNADAVSCCLVDSAHYENSMPVLKRNIPLLCEKPLAQNLDEAKDLAAYAETRDSVAMVNLSKRNAPALHALKRDLDAGLFGRVETVAARYHQSWVMTRVWGDWMSVPRWKWRLQPRFCTAGVAGDLGVHLSDALIYLFGNPLTVHTRHARDLGGLIGAGLIRAVGLEQSFFAGAAGPNIDNLSATTGSGIGPSYSPYYPAYVEMSADVVFDESIACDFSVSWVDETALDSFRIEVSGSDATAVLDLELSRNSYRFSSRDGEAQLRDGGSVPSTYELFVQAAKTGRKRNPDFNDALRAQELISRMLDTAVFT